MELKPWPKLTLNFTHSNGTKDWKFKGDDKVYHGIFMYFLFLDDPSKLAQTIFSKCGITNPNYLNEYSTSKHR